MGPLLLEVPQVPKVGDFAKKQKVLHGKSNTCYGSERKTGSVGLEASGDATWTHSSLLNLVIVALPKSPSSLKCLLEWKSVYILLESIIFIRKYDPLCKESLYLGRILACPRRYTALSF